MTLTFSYRYWHTRKASTGTIYICHFPLHRRSVCFSFWKKKNLDICWSHFTLMMGKKRRTAKKQGGTETVWSPEETILKSLQYYSSNNCFSLEYIVGYYHIDLAVRYRKNWQVAFRLFSCLWWYMEIRSLPWKIYFASASQQLWYLSVANGELLN